MRACACPWLTSARGACMLRYSALRAALRRGAPLGTVRTPSPIPARPARGARDTARWGVAQELTGPQAGGSRGRVLLALPPAACPRLPRHRAPPPKPHPRSGGARLFFNDAVNVDGAVDILHAVHVLHHRAVHVLHDVLHRGRRRAPSALAIAPEGGAGGRRGRGGLEGGRRSRCCPALGWQRVVHTAATRRPCERRPRRTAAARAAGKM